MGVGGTYIGVGVVACVRGLLGACGGVSSGVEWGCSVCDYCKTCVLQPTDLTDQRVLGDLL